MTGFFLMLILLQDSAPAQAEIDKAIDRGAAFLQKAQRPEGHWQMTPDDLMGHGLRDRMGPQSLGLTGLCLLALIHADIDPDDSSIERGMAYFLSQRDKFGHTYNCALALMAIEARAAKKAPRGKKISSGERRLAAELAQRIARGQRSDGYWTYAVFQGPLGTAVGEPKQRPFDDGLRGDLSNTQYALLGLRSASELGIKVDRDVWLKALVMFLDRQEKSGPSVPRFPIPAASPRKSGSKTLVQAEDFEARGWGYNPTIRPAAYGAATCIGIASLIICRNYLKNSAEFTDALAARTEKGIEDGCAWLAANFDVANNVKWQEPAAPYANTRPNIDGYYMYGIERAGILTGIKRLGEHDWYARGASILIDRQQEDGKWTCEMFYETRSPISTSFAVLFLKRATKPFIRTEGSNK